MTRETRVIDDGGTRRSAQQAVARITPADSDAKKTPPPTPEEAGTAAGDPRAAGAVTPCSRSPAGEGTVRIVHSRSRVTLPRLVVRPRRLLTEGVTWAALILSLAAGLGFFHFKWQETEDQLARERADRQAERDGRAGIYVYADKGIECKSPAISERWLDTFRTTCKSLGIAHRELTKPPKGAKP